MAVRKRFTPAERALLANASQALDWQNVTQWHPVTRGHRGTPAEVRTDGRGWQTYGPCTVAKTRGTVSAGECVYLTSSHLRPRPEAQDIPVPAEQRAPLGNAADVPPWHGVPRPAGMTLEAAREMLTSEARAGYAALGMDPDAAMRGY